MSIAELIRKPSPVDWIKLETSFASEPTDHGGGSRPAIPSIRARGGCDLMAISHYFMGMTPDLRTEFGILRANMLRVRLDHSWLMRLALKPPRPAVVEALHKLGYAKEDYTTTLFTDVKPGSVFLLSNWADTSLLVYRHRELGFAVPMHIHGRHGTDLTALPEDTLATVIPASAMDSVAYLRSHFTCQGIPTDKQIIANLELTFSQVPEGSRMFALLASESYRDKAGQFARLHKNARLNACLKAAAARFANVSLIDIAEFIDQPGDIQSIDHFTRTVYFRVAAHIGEQMRLVRAAEAGPVLAMAS